MSEGADPLGEFTSFSPSLLDQAPGDTSRRQPCPLELKTFKRQLHT